MKTMNEAGASVFAELFKIEPNCKIFQIASGENLDTAYLAKYGERMTFDDFSSIGTAQTLKVLNCANWDNAYDLFLASNDLIPALGNSSTTNTTKEYAYIDTVSDNESLPAFDSEITQLDRETNRTLNHDVSKDSTIETKDTKDISRFGAIYNYLQKHLINDIVYKDLNSLATLSIHTF